MTVEAAMGAGRASSRATLAPAALLALFLAVVGLAPHAWFSARLGELTYFKTAYDEDTYARLALHDEARSGRVLATALFKGLYAVGGVVAMEGCSCSR